MNPEDTRSMCYWLRIDNTKLGKCRGSLFGANYLTGRVDVVIINLRRIGFLAKSKAEFLSRLSSLMELTGKSLEIKRKLLEKLRASKLYPDTTFYLKDVKTCFGKYWRNDLSTIGLIGMNEACLQFLGEDMTAPRAKQFALEVLDFMRNKRMEFQQKTGNLYNLEVTPAEGTSFRLARKDKALFRDKS
jgi:ribonucleoside-triphosphate reductase